MHQDESAAEVRDLHERINTAVCSVVVGMEESTKRLLMSLIAGGHVLLEGVPGTAKTTLCRTFSAALGIHFERVQFTPDLLPSDVTGTQVLDRKTSDFVLRKGPIFCQLLLADELNRAPARTQSALLEAMQEQQVTIEGNTLQLPDPFMVLATQNPIEQEGVYRLPEAQLDRFLFRVLVDYPGRNAEIDMLRLHGHPVALPGAVTSIEEIVRLRSVVNDVHVADELNGYTIDLILATRAHSDLALGGSPRAAISLMRAAKAHALLSGRMFLTHEDIQSVAEPVLGHRLIIRPEAEMDGQTTSNVIADCVRSVPVLIDQSRQA